MFLRNSAHWVNNGIIYTRQHCFFCVQALLIQAGYDTGNRYLTGTVSVKTTNREGGWGGGGGVLS
jgi:hypothetical protein